MQAVFWGSPRATLLPPPQSPSLPTPPLRPQVSTKIERKRNQLKIDENRMEAPGKPESLWKAPGNGYRFNAGTINEKSTKIECRRTSAKIGNVYENRRKINENRMSTKIDGNGTSTTTNEKISEIRMSRKIGCRRNRRKICEHRMWTKTKENLRKSNVDENRSRIDENRTTTKTNEC